MTIVDHNTGEILDASVAETRAERICVRLDSAAEDFESAMELMRAAVRDRDDLALGYRSPGDYLSDRFGGRLARLGVDLRREVVRELTEAGLSTRAIAPVLDVSHKTVVKDRQAGGTSGTTSQTPASETSREAVSDTSQSPEVESLSPKGAAPDDSDVKNAPEASDPRTAPRPPVVGIDGKHYPAPTAQPKARPRRALSDQFFDAVFDLTKTVDRLARLTGDDRFTQNAQKVAAKNRDDLQRARDVLDDVLVRMP